MAESFNSFPIGSQRIKGYYSDKVNCPSDYISEPSQNVMVNDNGKVESRLGYTNEFSIGVTGQTATAIYHKTYDVAFFALGTKIYYRDYNTNTTVDTGITLTAGTKTRFDEFQGDIYLSNTTDGIIRICVGRLNDSAATLGDATFTVDQDFLGRMTAFGDTASVAIRINGTAETAASFVAATGVCTHATTLSKSYADNSVIIFVDNAYGALEKPSKLHFWKSAIHIMGFLNPTNTDQPNNSVMRGQFVIGETGSTGIENILDFTYGTGGSTKIMIGSGGKVTNVMGVKDTIYFFTENKTFAVNSAEINTGINEVTYSSTQVGLTIPREKDSLHGCVNEDSATAMGKNEIGFITSNKRIMRIRISPETGSAEPYSDESFDADISEIVKNMDNDQTGSLAFHYSGQRKTIFQIKVNGQWIWMIFDHNIQRQVGSTIVQGAWQPPQYIVPVTSLYERNGVLWGTDSSVDSVYSFFTTFTDDQSGFRQIIATGEFNVGNAIVKDAQVQGEINHSSEINIRCYVTNEKGGRRSGSAKVISGSDYAYGEDNSVGAVPVGEGVAGESTMIAKWKRSFGVFPSEATRAQLIVENDEEGGYMSVSAFQIDGQQYPHTFTKRL
jgi:hypothetical protein